MDYFTQRGEARISHPDILYVEVFCTLSSVTIISRGRVIALVAGESATKPVIIPGHLTVCVFYLGCTVPMEHFAKFM